MRRRGNARSCCSDWAESSKSSITLSLLSFLFASPSRLFITNTRAVESLRRRQDHSPSFHFVIILRTLNPLIVSYNHSHLPIITITIVFIHHHHRTISRSAFFLPSCASNRDSFSISPLDYSSYHYPVTLQSQNDHFIIVSFLSCESRVSVKTNLFQQTSSNVPTSDAAPPPSSTRSSRLSSKQEPRSKGSLQLHRSEIKDRLPQPRVETPPRLPSEHLPRPINIRPPPLRIVQHSLLEKNLTPH